MSWINVRTIRLAAASAIVLALAPSACGFDDTPTREEARVVLEGETDAPVQIVLSREFIQTQNEFGQRSIALFSADTAIVTPPFSRTMNIRNQQRFFARAEAADTVPTPVRMQVFLDGDLEFDQMRDLRDQRLQFSFQFNQQIVTQAP